MLSDSIKICTCESLREKRIVWELFFAEYPKESHGISEIEKYIDKVCDFANIIIAYDGNIIIGFIAFYANDYEKKIAYITQILVSSQYRNRRIGEMLINACEVFCRDKGFQELKLEVKNENIRAQKFYKRHNFEKETEKEKSFYMIKKI